MSSSLMSTPPSAATVDLPRAPALPEFGKPLSHSAGASSAQELMAGEKLKYSKEQITQVTGVAVLQARQEAHTELLSFQEQAKIQVAGVGQELEIRNAQLQQRDADYEKLRQIA